MFPGSRSANILGYRVCYQPSSLRRFFARFYHEEDKELSFTASRKKRKLNGIILDTFTTLPLEYLGDKFLYDVSFNINEGQQNQETLRKYLEEPTIERIIIQEQGKEERIFILHDPRISKWRDNTRILVKKIYPNGKSDSRKIFSVYDLGDLERYVRRLQK